MSLAQFPWLTLFAIHSFNMDALRVRPTAESWSVIATTLVSETCISSARYMVILDISALAVLLDPVHAHAVALLDRVVRTGHTPVAAIHIQVPRKRDASQVQMGQRLVWTTMDGRRLRSVAEHATARRCRVVPYRCGVLPQRMTSPFIRGFLSSPKELFDHFQDCFITYRIYTLR